jgi:hypothetical protein
LSGEGFEEGLPTNVCVGISFRTSVPKGDGRSFLSGVSEGFFTDGVLNAEAFEEIIEPWADMHINTHTIGAYDIAGCTYPRGGAVPNGRVFDSYQGLPYAWQQGGRRYPVY